MMNENCKYCDYVSKCMKQCEYNSILCKINRSFPKIVDISYEELKRQNKKYKEVINKAIEYLESKRVREKAIIDVDVLQGILKEVEHE